MKTLAIYVQIPFCSSKCAFCNFSSKVAPASALRTYLATLEHEIDLLPRFAGENREPLYAARQVLALPVDSVYLGGGTPTLAGGEGLERIFSALRRQFSFGTAPEITLEMTPGSAGRDLLDACRALGINRLSIGAQSFDDRELCSVGRLHSAAETVEQVRWARKAGFGNISLDLIAGLPYQTEISWLDSIRQAIELAPEHVSVYLFEVDDKSRLGNEVLRQGGRYHAAAVPDDDFMAEAYERAGELLAKAGYAQYEISNFARPGFESRHNRRYWRLDPYIGLGAGAHSFDGHCRWSNESSTEAYTSRIARGEIPITGWRRLADTEQIEEFFFLGLRQREGINLGSALARWGLAVEPWQPRIASLLRQGLLEKQGETLRLAPRAYLVSNEVFQEFLA